MLFLRELPEEVKEEIKAVCFDPQIQVQMTGSRVICREGVRHSADYDVVVYSPVDVCPYFELPERSLKYSETVEDPDYGPEDLNAMVWYCITPSGYRVNFIATLTKQYFDKWAVATSLAMKMELAKRSDRVALFKAVIFADQYEAYEILNKRLFIPTPPKVLYYETLEELSSIL